MLLVLKEFLFLDPGRKAGYSRGQCDFGSNVQVVMNTNMDVALWLHWDLIFLCFQHCKDV